MKNFYLLLSAMLVAGAAQARHISADEALALAASKVPALAAEAGCNQARLQSANGAEAPIYLFNAPAGGFAIVAADDAIPSPLLAYSDRGSFDPATCAPAARAWLDELTAFVAAGDFSKVRPRNSELYANPVAPLITTKWNQDFPYNMLTPTAPSGEHCPTGCGATAIAQILNYWEYPKEGGLAEHSYEWNGQILTVDFRQSRYDWDNMADVYDQNSTEAQNLAVAKLMWDCGVAADMIYDVDASSSNIANTALGMVDFVGYSHSTEINFRCYYTTSQWIALINDELDSARPVFYTGATANQEGHAFVCDGYDSEGLYHINWGWGGQSDGYFDLTTLDPNTQGIGGAASGEGFSCNQAVLTHLQPAQPDEDPSLGWKPALDEFSIEADNEEATSFSLGFTLYNAGYHTFVGSIIIRLDNVDSGEAEEGVLVEFDEDQALDSDSSYECRLQGIQAAGMPDGLYRISLKARDDAGNPEVAVLTPAIGMPMRFEIRDGRMIYDELAKLALSDVEIDEIGFFNTTDEGLRTSIANITFTLSNISDVPYLDGISIATTSTGLDGVSVTEAYDFLENPEIAPEEGIVLTVPVRFGVESSVQITVSGASRTGEEVQEAEFTDNVFEFSGDSAYHELELADMPEISEEEGRVSLKVQVGSCSGTVEMSDGCPLANLESLLEKEITCTISSEDSDALPTVLTATYSGVWNQIQTLVFATAEALPVGNYSAEFSYLAAPDAGGNAPELTLGAEDEDFPGISFAVTTEAGLNLPTAASAAAATYTVAGVRVHEGAALAPGCYIVVSDGKARKVMVK